MTDIAGRIMHPPILSLVGLPDPVEHARRRRPWTRAFSTSALKEYHPIIHKRVAQLTEALAHSCVSDVANGRTDAKAEKEVWTNLAQWVAFFTYDFMGDLV